MVNYFFFANAEIWYQHDDTGLVVPLNSHKKCFEVFHSVVVDLLLGLIKEMVKDSWEILYQYSKPDFDPYSPSVHPEESASKQTQGIYEVVQLVACTGARDLCCCE